MTSNVINLPTYGKAIGLDDQGVYFTLNPSTGSVHSILQLVYDDEWYLFQLQKTGQEDEAGWIMMTEEVDSALVSVSTTELRRHFSKLEYEEPRGAWQIIRNAKFGFGKFTPANQEEIVCHAIMVFSGDEMHAPVRLYKADEETLKRAEQASVEHTELV
jgi:hypothetical protein